MEGLLCMSTRHPMGPMGVGDKEGFGGGVDDLEAAVLFQGRADVEAVTGAEGPGGVGGGLVMYEYAASDGADGGRR